MAINYEHQAFAEGSAIYDVERSQLAGIHSRFSQNDTSISKNSWGYVTNQDYKRVEWLIGDLVDVVSKNGAMLLNVGPKPDGTIPEPEEAILLGIGEWLALNGEAIHGTRPWKVFGEGPTEVPEGSFIDTKRMPFSGRDFRFTSTGETVYAIALAWPGEQAVIHSLGTSAGLWEAEIGRVLLLGYADDLSFQRDANGLTVHLPGQPPCQHAFVFKISRE